MDRYLTVPQNSAPDYSSFLEKMYPDSYIRIYPHIQYMVNSMDDDGMYGLTHDDMDRMTEEVLSRSGMPSDPPAGHSRNMLGDLTRALLIRELLNRHRQRIPFPPFILFPFVVRDFDRDIDRGFDRDMRRDRDRERGWY